jgi:hypothetical protein
MQNRRQFLGTLIRGSILASLTLLSGILIRRWNEADGCHQNYICGNCKLSNNCRLIEAKNYRENKPGSKENMTENGRTRK